MHPLDHSVGECNDIRYGVWIMCITHAWLLGDTQRSDLSQCQMIYLHMHNCRLQGLQVCTLTKFLGETIDCYSMHANKLICLKCFTWLIAYHIYDL